MDEYRLLITHAEKWAQKSKRPLDVDLLGTALSLRDVQDRMPGTSWPEGSADYLMTVRWPGHGPLGVPDVDALVDTLDTFWRFLRSTGRMASGSADPKELTREAKRAKSRMRANCESPASFGSTKVLQSFGDEIGISLEGAAGVDDLNERFSRITEAWNALPMQERRDRMPGPIGADSTRSHELTQMAGEFMADTDLNAYAAEHGYPVTDEQWDDNDELDVPAQDPAVVSKMFRESPYFQALERLLTWIGKDGRPATASGYLKPASAREVIAELGLDEWMESVFGYAPVRWRSAGDHMGLERLLYPAERAELIEVTPTRIRLRPRPQTDEDWTIIAVTALVALHERCSEMTSGQRLLTVMLAIHFADMRTPEKLRTWWRQSPANPFQSSLVDEQFQQVYDEMSDEAIDRVLKFWDDTHIWRTRGGRLELSELGLAMLPVLAHFVDPEERY